MELETTKISAYFALKVKGTENVLMVVQPGDVYNVLKDEWETIDRLSRQEKYNFINRFISSNNSLWTLPGGGSCDKEEPKTTAAREFNEELNGAAILEWEKEEENYIKITPKSGEPEKVKVQMYNFETISESTPLKKKQIIYIWCGEISKETKEEIVNRYQEIPVELIKLNKNSRIDHEIFEKSCAIGLKNPKEIFLKGNSANGWFVSDAAITKKIPWTA